VTSFLLSRSTPGARLLPPAIKPHRPILLTDLTKRGPGRRSIAGYGREAGGGDADRGDKPERSRVQRALADDHPLIGVTVPTCLPPCQPNCTST
jgi:hypothetical protein